ncbi:hypothetical protein FOA43_001165 [Brettanomyces nanus]|uniref:WD repeat-containing protein 48 n=1 Tax=Eeniella nana TaxID=13502 RepID=A0A875RNK4_EENNA|nr:uncharacterized protein FOA43_001165 [Brettanomyces nanus]QPG73850.1 hypothetical protein FOA43_001165 [Brettanomyces nanus]
MTSTNASTATTSPGTAPRKRTISYIVNTADHELLGHHSLGVNALEYDSGRHMLISGGRDGVVSTWKPHDLAEEPAEPSNPFLLSEDFDSVYDDSEKIKQYISDNLDNEAEISKLEESIRGCSLSERQPTATNYQLSDTGHLHLDWINDLKVLSCRQLTVASCSNDTSVKLWNIEGEHPQVSTLGYHDDYVKTLAYTKSHKNQLISGGLDRCVKIWDMVTQSCVDSYQFPQEKGSVYTMDCYRNFIICGGPTNVSTLFDRRDMKKPIKMFMGHTDTVRCLKLGPKSFLSGSSDTTVRLWDLRTNRTMRNFDMHDSSVWSLCVPGVDESKETPSFDLFYSGDRNGLVLKTDLRASDLDPDSSGFEKRDYFNDKVNSSLGISTIVADLAQNCSRWNPPGVLNIVNGDNSIWVASTADKDKFITNWKVPNTNRLVLYQGIKLYRNLKILGRDAASSPAASPEGAPASPSASALQHMGSSGAFSLTSLSNDTSIDLVSQFSHDDMNQIDEALTSQFMIDKNIDGNIDGDIQNNQNDFSDPSPGAADLRLNTYFLSLNGGPDSEYIIINNEKGLDIAYEKVPDYLVDVIAYNDEPFQAIKGSNGLIMSRMLNNRRHVATMDQNGCIYLIDIVSGKLIKKLESIDQPIEETGCLDISDRFDDISDKFQTDESLPQWCSVQTKGGMLFVTLQESTFTNCEVYDDELAQAYPEFIREDDGDDPIRYNIGKVVLKSLLSNFTEEIFTEKFVIGREKRRKDRREAEAGEASSGKKSLWKTRRSKDTTKASPSSSVASIHPHPHPPLPSLSSSSSSPSLTSSISNDKHKKKFFRISSHHGKQSPYSEERDNNNQEEVNTMTPSEERAKRITEAVQKFQTTEQLLEWMDDRGMKHSEQAVIVPRFQYDGKVLVTINENVRSFGNDTKTLFLTHLSNMKANTAKFEEYLPIWVSRAILLGRYPHKEVPKVGFTVTPDKEASPELEFLDSSRLTAYNLMRMGKVIEYVKEKLPEEQKGLELEVLCRDHLLPLNATLNTVKIRIWKSSSDVGLIFRVKRPSLNEKIET